MNLFKNKNKIREKLALGDKLKKCPLCSSEQEEGYDNCFHCASCSYLQCCDYDGFYNKAAKRNLKIIK